MKKFDNIPGFSGYFISPNGILYSRKSGKWKKHGYGLSNTHRVRYKIHGDNGKYKWKQASRLVAEAYLPNPDHLPIVMHLDNNPNNNHYSNLKWGTQSDNIQQAYDEHRAKAPKILCTKGEKHPNSTLSNNQRYEIVDKYLNKGVSTKDLHKQFGISRRHINKIIKDFKDGVRW